MKKISDLRKEFCNAHPDELLDRPTTAAGIGYSMGWMEMKATIGGGPPFYKRGRHVLYRKSDTMKWFEQNSKLVHSTSEI